MPTSSPRAGLNLLLTRLPEPDRERLLRTAQPVPLKYKDLLEDPGTPAEFVYFPVAGAVSVLNLMTDGTGIEVAIIGREGVAGLQSCLFSGVATTRLIVQVPGEAIRLPSEAFRQEVERSGPVRRLLFRYAGAIFKELAQSIACNGLHPVSRRCCRWLLLTHDRVGDVTFPMTHEFMAEMLGVRRPTVSEVLKDLMTAGLLRYARGQIVVLDRAGLETRACECYRAVRDEFDRVVG